MSEESKATVEDGVEDEHATLLHANEAAAEARLAANATLGAKLFKKTSTLFMAALPRTTDAKVLKDLDFVKEKDMIPNHFNLNQLFAKQGVQVSLLHLAIQNKRNAIVEWLVRRCSSSPPVCFFPSPPAVPPRLHSRLTPACVSLAPHHSLPPPLPVQLANKADPDLPSSAGETPLHMALVDAKKGKAKETIALLLQHGAHTDVRSPPCPAPPMAFSQPPGVAQTHARSTYRAVTCAIGRSLFLLSLPAPLPHSARMRPASRPSSARPAKASTSTGSFTRAPPTRTAPPPPLLPPPPPRVRRSAARARSPGPALRRPTRQRKCSGAPRRSSRPS